MPAINFKWLAYISFIALVSSDIPIPEPARALVQCLVIKVHLYGWKKGAILLLQWKHRTSTDRPKERLMDVMKTDLF